jgi:hypothetical protein
MRRASPDARVLERLLFQSIHPVAERYFQIFDTELSLTVASQTDLGAIIWFLKYYKKSPELVGQN